MVLSRLTQSKLTSTAVNSPSSASNLPDMATGVDKLMVLLSPNILMSMVALKWRGIERNSSVEVTVPCLSFSSLSSGMTKRVTTVRVSIGFRLGLSSRQRSWICGPVLRASWDITERNLESMRSSIVETFGAKDETL